MSESVRWLDGCEETKRLPWKTLRREWFGALEDRTIGLVENEVTGAAIGFVTLVAVVLSMVGVSCSFVFGAFFVGSHVMELPFLGQFFGP